MAENRGFRQYDGDRMSGKSVSRVTDDPIYRAIKASVVAYEFPQGQRIYVEKLAKAHGVSATPVRRVLNRLVDEELVIRAGKRGFISMPLSRNDLLGQYAVIRMTLTKELNNLAAPARRDLSHYEPIAGVLKQLDRIVPSDFGALATCTGETFARLAALSTDDQVVDVIHRANDRLYYIRTLECQRLDNVQGELQRMCELLLAGECDELIGDIHAYHDRRVALLPTLLDLAPRDP